MTQRVLLAVATDHGNLLGMNRSRACAWLVGCVAMLFFGACTAPPPTAPTTRKQAAWSANAVEAAQERPGLGTRWGETRESQVIGTGFRRAEPERPRATATIHYNDQSGIRAMAGSAQPRRARPALSGAADSLIAVELRDQSGSLLPGLAVDGRWFVVGERGRRYSIVVRNESDARIEVVLSVDGLDVLDGRAASDQKRGYVIAPGGRLNVEGFRQSFDAVAAFRFGSVSESYANRKYGDTRNVGVIGVAVFHEYGSDPFVLRERERRLRASPFPGNFASPPEPMPVRPPSRRP